MTSDTPIWSSVARHFHAISLCRLACWALALCAMSSSSMPGDELTRYQKWQQHRPFTQSAWYTSITVDVDGALAPPVSLPPTWHLPDMDLYRRAGLNLVTDLTGMRGEHPQAPGEGYAAVAQSQFADVPFFHHVP